MLCSHCIWYAQDKNPSDETVLTTLGHCFRLAHRDVEVAECYESALAQQPGNEELAVQLFKACARCGDAKKMQTCALKLYKTHNNSKYVFWAVCSMLQQDGVNGTVLMLAERMLRRVMFETQALHPPKRTAGAEEALLWVDVLSRQAELASTPEDRVVKLREALATLRDVGEHAEKAGGSAAMPVMHNPIELDYRIDSDVQFKRDPSIVELHPFMGKMRQLQVVQLILSSCFSESDIIPGADGSKYGSRSDFVSQLVSLFEDILHNYPDQWDVHELWIDHVVNGGVATDVFAHREKLHAMQANFPKLRGPYLAEMHLLNKSYSKVNNLCSGWTPCAITSETESMSGLPVEPFFHAEMTRLISRYVSLFEFKECCFSDIKKYIDCTYREAGSDDTCRNLFVEWLTRRRDEASAAAWDLSLIHI